MQKDIPNKDRVGGNWNTWNHCFEPVDLAHQVQYLRHRELADEKDKDSIREYIGRCWRVEHLGIESAASTIMPST